MRPFIAGAVAMAYAVAGLFFLRYWKDTRDRLFLIFAAAFGILGLIRVVLTVVGQPSEAAGYLYWARFVAYLFLLAAIVDKNRR